MTSPFATKEMHAFKQRIFRRQADAIAKLGPRPTPKRKLGEQPAVQVNPMATGKPFDVPAMADLKRRARRRADLASVTNAWRGNEGALLEQIAAGDDIKGLIESMERREDMKEGHEDRKDAVVGLQKVIHSLRKVWGRSN